MRIAGDKVHAERVIEVHYPYTGEIVATVPRASIDDVRRAIRIARDYKPRLTRHERFRILSRAGELIAQRKEAIARQITLESGLCLKDSLYEVGARQRRAAVLGAAGAGRRRPELLVRPHAPRQAAPRAHAARAAAGRDHRDHAVQPPAEPGDPQGGAGDRHQQPHGAQAEREDAAGRADAGRRAVRGRAAAADAVGDHRRAGRDRRRDADAPRRRPGHLHRRRDDRQAHRRARGLQAPDPRTRRQRPDRGDGRRRRQQGGRPRRQRLVQEQRPALHRGQAHLRAGAAGRRLHRGAAGARPRPGPTATRSTRPSTWAR